MSAAETNGPDYFGLMAEFDNPEDLLASTQKAYAAGYRQMDAYTPFPVHGLAEALGVRRNWVPYIVLLGAIGGGISGFLLQYYAAAISYPLNVAGRPLNSWPAFLVITFEMAVLGAGVLGMVGMIALNKLPMPYHPVFNVPDFQLATNDRFFLCIMQTDPQFDLEKTRRFLEDQKPYGVFEVEQDASAKIYD